MADKITLQTVDTLQNQVSALSKINSNFSTIAEKLDTLVSRDGDSPNQMESNLDMNSYRIQNLPIPASNTEPVRRKEFYDAIDDINAYAPVQSVNGETGDVVLNKTHIGLSNVDNTSDTDKPVSTAAQAALDLKAPLASPALTGTPTAPTAAGGTNTTQIATTAFTVAEIASAIASLVDSSPATLDTLNELAAALGDDPNFATTVTNALATKLPSASYTAADVLAKLLTVDGSGSGLDADLVRGVTPSAFGLSVLDDANAAAARTTLGLAAVAASGSASDLVSGTVPSARLPSQLQNMATTISNWNEAVDHRVLYVGENKPNAPTLGTGQWYYGWFLGDGGAWGTQYCVDFFSQKSYRRSIESGVWQAWERIRETEAELDVRYGFRTLGQAVAVGASVTLTASDVGKNYLALTPGQTITLPLSANCGSGGLIFIKNVLTSNITVALASGDSWDAASGVVPPGRSVMFVADGGISWRAMLQENLAFHRTDPDEFTVDGTNDRIPFWDVSAGAFRLTSPTTIAGTNTAGVGTFEGRSGSVVSQPGDYTAAEITNTPAGGIAATTVQAALNELDTEKAALSNPTFTGGQNLPASGGFKFIKCITLSTGADLDLVTESGFYDLDSPTNGPYSGVGWGYLEVIRHSGSDQFCIQRFTHLYFSREVVWQRRKISNVWGTWKPISGYATPAHFGATGGSTLSGASTDDTTAIGKWLDYGIANPGIPLILDQFYKITSALSKDISSVNGFGIRSLGPAARAGLYMSGTTAQIAISGADQSNPSGFDADQYHFSDFMIGIDADRSNFLIGISAAADSGSDAPGLHMSNVHVRRSGDGYGVTGETFYFQDIRQFDVSNVSAQGKYFGYAGNMFRLAAAAGGAPVEGSFTNCRASHFQKMLKFDASSGATANDDWQGMHLDRCSAIAVDTLVHAETGTEGFSEWLTIDRCHAYFREIAVYGVNVGNVKVSNSYFLGHGALSTIQGVALTGTSIIPVVDVSHNTINLTSASGATRLGINVPTMAGVAVHNRISNATSNTYGSLTQSDNLTF